MTHIWCVCTPIDKESICLSGRTLSFTLEKIIWLKIKWREPERMKCKESGKEGNLRLVEEKQKKWVLKYSRPPFLCALRCYLVTMFSDNLLFKIISKVLFVTPEHIKINPNSWKELVVLFSATQARTHMFTRTRTHNLLARTRHARRCMHARAHTHLG